jgi:tetratricopeptide (TPR) repeat protein
MAQPVCFMVMPFGTKAIEPRPTAAPDRIDFDALWNKALQPVIVALGYEPVRADQDAGAAIILEMLERLYFSDLVVADMTLPNGNVYYEIGIRHACKPTGCVLLSADWTVPLFDVNQMRRVVYPLPEGAITDATAAAIRTKLEQGVKALAEGASPMYQHIPGFPDPKKIDPARASSIRKQLDQLAAFQARVREARLASAAPQRRGLALALQRDYPANKPMSQAVALEMAAMLRDCAGWKEAAEYIHALPASIRDLDSMQEQRNLALSKTGEHLKAIAALEELVRRSGDTSERQGLLGGRHKKLAGEANKSGDDKTYRRHLNLAIKHYEQGMRLDLNDYYPTSNLSRLYRERGGEGDAARAATASQITLIACERAKARGVPDEWLNPTLLGAAFDAADVAAAKHLLQEVSDEGAAAWKLETTIADLERSVGQVKDPGQRQALAGLLEELRALIR